MLRKKILIILLLSFCVSSLFAATAKKEGPVWKQVRREGEITIYVHKDSADIIKVKTDVAINANIKLVLEVLDSIEQRKSWVPFLKESRVLKEISETDNLEYSLFDAPWPASDRDFVYLQEMKARNAEEVIYSMRITETDLMPEKKGIVRAALIESEYTLTVMNENQTYVEFVFFADPKGWVPDWVVNVIQKRLPYMMLRNLKSKVERMAKRKVKKQG